METIINLKGGTLYAKDPKKIYKHFAVDHDDRQPVHHPADLG